MTENMSVMSYEMGVSQALIMPRDELKRKASQQFS